MLMLRRTWHEKSSSVALGLLLLCVLHIGINATPTNVPSSINTTENFNNFNCPEDCHCQIAATHNTHAHQFLHAKCSSLNGLKSSVPIVSTMPIHSIDLSFLNLARLSHSLDRLHDLTSIDLSHNELHEFGHLSRRIKKLNLKHNRIPSSKLNKLPHNIQVLNLQHNDITYLPLELTKLTHLISLELSENPINCSCETLEVRNWLQERNIFMENAVTCYYPTDLKGKPWLQIRQSDVCGGEKNLGLEKNLEIDDNENELMLGDQPAVEASGDAEDDDEEELGKDFMPVETKATTISSSNELDPILNDVEGSGDLRELNMRLEGTSERSLDEVDSATENEEEEDGSGSGGGILILPELPHHEAIDIADDDFDPPVTYISAHNDNDSAYDNKPVEEPAVEEATPSPEIFGNGMGIFDPANEGISTENPVDEEPIIPIKFHNVGAPASGDTESVGISTEGPEKDASIMQAKVGDDGDNNATYLLLGVIGLIVIGLILFVGIKRCKSQRNARHDAENPRQTELLDMDKKNLGKPLYKENAPLIGEKTKSDQAKPINGAGKPYDSSDVKDGGAQGQPLLKNGNSNGATPKDAVESNLQPSEAPANAQQNPPHEYYPITPRYPTPKSPRASKYAQYPQGESNNNTINADDAYMPSSPKTGRYSPVYSPETGRVKIKLTETPKPKTPMLVTRSKSNAGEIITTPVAREDRAVHGINGLNGNAPVGVHMGTNGHAAGHY